MGPCAGGAVYSPAITDLVVMVDGTSYMFVTGPNVVKTVTHEEIDFEGLGGARIHNETSGVAHFLSPGEPQALHLARTLIGYLPPNNVDLPPRHDEWSVPGIDGATLDALVPDSPKQSYDMHTVIDGIVDEASFTEVHAGSPRNIICGLGARGGSDGRDRGAATGGACRRSGHRCLRQGGAIRPYLRLLQHPDHHPGGRSRIPARRRAGASRHHPSRREAAVRLLRGDRTQGHRHHPQGVRRRLRRDEQQAGVAAT